MLPRKQAHAKILLTGFDAFGGDAINPSWLVAQALHGKSILGYKIVAAQLPTRFGASLQSLQALLKLHQPLLVLCLGQAGGRGSLSLERIAINVDDARITDNAGAQPVDTPVVAGGPAAYFSSLPIKAMHQALQTQGIAAEVSQTAGTFVCNHVFYGLMHHLATTPGLANTRGGFVHVPYVPEQCNARMHADGVPSMSLAQMVQGIGLALRVALETPTDLKLGTGALH